MVIISIKDRNKIAKEAILLHVALGGGGKVEKGMEYTEFFFKSQ